MNKAELASRLADRLGVSKKLGDDFVDAFEDIVTKTLVGGGEVTIAGFGTFSARKRAGRIGVNPRDPSKPITINPVTVAKFKAGSALKKILKQGERTAASTPPQTISTPS
ncbi:HU family DNA-binding protein [Candidatus Uhrbacteria bacterium]|nr:HU family DNA-binding protein [Candidatus Uhrbacteria bacterium]